MSISLGTNLHGFAAGAGTQGTSNTGTTTSGSSIICFQSCPNGSTPGCWTDNFGNTYSALLSDQVDAGQGFRTQCYSSVNITGGASHLFTQLFADRFISASFYAIEILGLSNTSQLDTSAQGNDTTPFNTPITTTIANDIILTFLRSSGGPSFTPNGGFATLDSAVGGSSTAVMYRIVSSAGAYDAAPVLSPANEIAWMTIALKAPNSSILMAQACL